LQRPHHSPPQRDQYRLHGSHNTHVRGYVYACLHVCACMRSYRRC
jgi:hypothetical protein